MSKDTVRKLVEARLRVVNDVNAGKLAVEITMADNVVETGKLA